MSPGLAIVLIIVLWLLILAPILLRGQKPMSRTGEAFDDTRVLFEGDSGALEPQRGPKLSAKAARIKARKDAEAEAEANTDAAQDGAAEQADDAAESNEEKQTIAAAAARIKSEYDNAKAQSEADNSAEPAEAAETIEGEIVYEVEAADSKKATDSAASSDADSAADAADDIVDVDVVDAEVEQPQQKAPAQSAMRPVTVELSDEDLDALEGGLDEDDDILLEDEPRKESPKASFDAEVSASESTVFTAPAAYELADDAYEMDETYVSAVDMMYPGAVDPDTEANADAVADEELTSAAEHNTDEDLEDGVGADTNEVAVADEDVTHYEVNQEFEEDLVGADSDTELSEEELEFAQSRVGRGGWDPQADAENKATRYQRRQRTLMGLAIVVVLTVALGIIFGGWLWWAAAIAGGLTIAYLVALRTQVRQEQQLRARRISQLRRARLGVRSAQDEELAIPRYLRRPGAVIVEIDDSSPDWDHLPEMHEEVEDIPQRPAPRRIRRDDLAARRVG
ncbi:membrane protein [Corynebacterium stationis]|uniref:divisome protein SepX/GlpR n=1 Tax=Corynebacterium stationis TaxID=1705 RepID=UPI0009504B26|nr:gephyrin-like molybdotransferase receptor GlpR [Corynebacterium stationis]APT95478.1 membrane protein [Corynebacterium stationis]